jgi:hypothetical protein
VNSTIANFAARQIEFISAAETFARSKQQLDRVVAKNLRSMPVAREFCFAIRRLCARVAKGLAQGA